MHGRNIITCLYIYIYIYIYVCVCVCVWTGQRRRYSDWLLAGRSGWGEIFRTRADRPWDPPRLLYNGYRVFPGGKERPGRESDPSPPSSAVVKKQQRYTSTPPMGRTACTEPHCLHSTSILLLPLWVVRPVQSFSACTVQLYVYSPYGPYSLYRPSVHVQYSYTSTTLRAVRSLATLSACTVQLYLYHPQGRMDCGEPQCLYSTAIPLNPYGRTDFTDPQCLYSSSIPLPPLGSYGLQRLSVPVQYSYTSTTLRAVRSVETLSACTLQLYLYHPQGRTVCRDPQYLYSTAIPLPPLGAYGLQRLSVPVQYSYTSTTLMAVRSVESLSACTVQLYLYHSQGRTFCREPQCLYSTAIPINPYGRTDFTALSACTVQLYLYQPQGRTFSRDPQFLCSTAITLLPLWAVQPVQTLSACTVQLYLYYPYGPYRLYRCSVPVQYRYTSTTLRAVRSVQTLNACKIQLNLYNPQGRTVCRDPQCLYITVIPLLPLWAVQPVQALSACTVQIFLYSPQRPYRLHRPSVPVQYS